MTGLSWRNSYAPTVTWLPTLSCGCRAADAQPAPEHLSCRFWATAPMHTPEILAHCQTACKPALALAEAENDQKQFSPCVFCMFVINCALRWNISIQVRFSSARGILMYLSLGEGQTCCGGQCFTIFVFLSASRHKC